MKNNLKKIRIEKGLQQKNIAEVLEVSMSTVSYLENSPIISSEYIQKLCAFLNVSADALLGLDENKVTIILDRKDGNQLMKLLGRVNSQLSFQIFRQPGQEINTNLRITKSRLKKSKPDITNKN